MVCLRIVALLRVHTGIIFHKMLDLPRWTLSADSVFFLKILLVVGVKREH